MTGDYNTASGYSALISNTTGFNNTAHGSRALYYNTTGTNNTAQGDAAGFFFNNTNSSFLGAQSNSNAVVNNSTALGFQAVVNDDNQVRIGNTAVTSIGGQVDWTTLSDGRFKNNLKEDVPGISFINKLRPITYNLDVSAIDLKLKTQMPQLKQGAEKLMAQSQPSADQQKSKAAKAQIKYTGFVAQDVEKAAQELGYDFSGVDAPKNKEGFYGLRYSEFVVPLVKAVQEQQKQIDEQQKEIGELKELVAKLINGHAVITPTHSTTTITGAYLEQNIPNPFGGNTNIAYHLPSINTTGKVVISSVNGQVLKTLIVNGSQRGVLTLQAGSLAAGTYIYSLWVDNQAVDTKQMIVR